MKEAVFSIIEDNDPYKAPKQLQLKGWCGAFLPLFAIGGEKRLPFFLGVLSDKECWEEVDTIHGIMLNRRVTAEKMVELQNWKGISNPLSDFDRYRVACWCCLEGDIAALFEYSKQKSKIKDGDTAALKKFVGSMSGGTSYTSLMTKYWSHVMSERTSELKLGGRHLYVYGLDLALGMLAKCVEAVEFFWGKVESLPEDELSAQRKDEIFMKAVVYAAGRCGNYPEIFGFCFDKIGQDKYLDLLRRDLSENRDYTSLYLLKNALCFDRFRKLFDCLEPSDISEDDYCLLLTCMDFEEYTEYYADAGVKLFMHMWTKEGFDNHRAFVLEREISRFTCQGAFLTFLVKKDFMEPVWAILDKANPDKIKEFMNCRRAGIIRSVLEEREDQDSLNKFLSYNSSAIEDA